MKVVILCGGRGARLQEETEYRPKPMIEIGGRPIIWHIMKIYAHYGFNDFVICLGYRGHMIKEYFYNYELMNSDFTVELGENKSKSPEIHNPHQEQGWSITLAETGLNTLKGARIKKAEKYINSDTFMVTYGDGLSDVNISELLAFHKEHGRIATVTGVRPLSRFGELETNDSQVTKFSEKSQSLSGWINGGFFVFNRKLFDLLSTDDDCDLEYGPLEKLVEDGELMFYKHLGFWQCMDHARDLQYLVDLWDEGKAAWTVWSNQYDHEC